MLDGLAVVPLRPAHARAACACVGVVFSLLELRVCGEAFLFFNYAFFFGRSIQHTRVLGAWLIVVSYFIDFCFVVSSVVEVVFVIFVLLLMVF